MSHLLVTLAHSAPTNNSAQELAYALVSSAGVVTAHGSATPALLPKADQATLLVPASAMSWHLAALPKLPRGSSAQKAQALLAGVLEEQLLDEPSQMHLVACPSLALEGKTWVAACQKALLQSTAAALQAQRVPLARIVPEVFPSESASLHVSGTPQSAWLTYADAQGVLRMPLAHAAVLPELAQIEPVTAEPAVAANAEQALQRRVTVTQAAQRALQSMQAAQTSGVDLAQGDLAVSGGGRMWQSVANTLSEIIAAPVWAPVRWGLALLLLANIVGLNAWAWKQDAAVADKRRQMNQLLTQSFPNVKVVVDAPLQMQRELASLRQAQGQLSGRDFESIYGRFMAVASTNTAPAAIDFVVNEVQIRGAGLAPAQIDALLPRLQYAGLQVRSDAQALIVSHRDVQANVGGKP
jgi:general secretion pathway protein L